MTEAKPTSPEATEAETVGERPDLGRTPDALRDALTGSGGGSDTRAGSLQGGAATGSDDDPDQASVDEAMRAHGRARAGSTDAASGNPVNNTGASPGQDDPTSTNRSADAATG